MIKLTILFEDPFWIGILDIWDNDELRTAKITFGSEPKDYEVNDFINANFYKLKFSPPVKDIKKKEQHKNPKRVRREINKALQQKTISTKSQQALSLEREQNKVSRKKKTKLQKDEEKEQMYILKQEKKKKKKQGH